MRDRERSGGELFVGLSPAALHVWPSQHGQASLDYSTHPEGGDTAGGWGVAFAYSPSSLNQSPTPRGSLISRLRCNDLQMRARGDFTRYLVQFLLAAFERNSYVIRSFLQAKQEHQAALDSLVPFPKVEKNNKLGFVTHSNRNVLP